MRNTDREGANSVSFQHQHSLLQGPWAGSGDSVVISGFHQNTLLVVVFASSLTWHLGERRVVSSLVCFLSCKDDVCCYSSEISTAGSGLRKKNRATKERLKFAWYCLFSKGELKQSSCVGAGLFRSHSRSKTGVTVALSQRSAVQLHDLSSSVTDVLRVMIKF